MRDVARRPVAAAIVLALVAASVAAVRPAVTTGHDIPGFDRFMYALGQVESGGRYDAYNPTSGAYGKYQIIPSSWRAWAKEVLGSADAPKTPENQEKVARYKIHQAWHNIGGGWRPVAYWWLTGRVSRDESTWSSYAKSYVNKIMTIYNDTASAPPAPSVWTATYQESYRYIGWTGTWGTAKHTAYQGNTVRWSQQPGATATFTFTGRSVAWIGPKGPTRGQAKVWVDGKYVKTIDLYASSFRAVATVFTRSWSSVAKHTLRVEVVGTKGRPVVAIDAFRITK